ncbi:hypothetical protein GCK72_020559 [Caenorhabditis remanei]|uniref:CRE-CLEC-224 protein n=2 Tax=Caenorhabditis remanei TaxID=31234 RepID=E3MWR9_CAERE|nr:hypothetical protein GCK72_020559 [Caenorhabditis remanei]EFP10708.1 CRE-CLEC-224 protein [Caenorhabditis remanei]KAF1754001.1 hypothetical protein GCK72_020559 [Caenorhabditis remanei]
MKLLFVLFLKFVFISAQLDLNSIKKQQTYPATGPTTISTSAASTVGPCVGCQYGWVPYGGSCYKKMLDVLTQSTAEQECITLGAHLASFETNDKATAIKNLVLSAPLFSTDLFSYSSSSQESWIGLSKTSNGAWKWTDASEVEFANLPTGTSVTGASCVSMNTSGVWKPNDCTSTVTSFICKRLSSPL